MEAKPVHLQVPAEARSRPGPCQDGGVWVAVNRYSPPGDRHRGVNRYSPPATQPYMHHTPADLKADQARSTDHERERGRERR